MSKMEYMYISVEQHEMNLEDYHIHIKGSDKYLGMHITNDGRKDL